MALIYGHRGASADAPENTLAAFGEAVRQGADGVELDVQICRSGEAVVIHDETLERVAGVEGWVRDFTLAELKALDVGRTHPGFGRAAIPTLEEVYALLAPTGLCVNAELKTSLIDFPGIERLCVDLAERAGMTGRVLYSSFNHMTLRRVKQIDPSLPCGLLYNLVMERPWEYAADRGMQALHPAFPELRLEPGMTAAAHAAGIRVHPWTVNAEEDVRMCLAAGADMLITNHPAKARRIMESMEGQRNG